MARSHMDAALSQGFEFEGQQVVMRDVYLYNWWGI
jgi:hypothetical protein